MLSQNNPESLHEKPPSFSFSFLFFFNYFLFALLTGAFGFFCLPIMTGMSISSTCAATAVSGILPLHFYTWLALQNLYRCWVGWFFKRFSCSWSERKSFSSQIRLIFQILENCLFTKIRWLTRQIQFSVSSFEFICQTFHFIIKLLFTSKSYPSMVFHGFWHRLFPTKWTFFFPFAAFYYPSIHLLPECHRADHQEASICVAFYFLFLIQALSILRNITYLTDSY